MLVDSHCHLNLINYEALGSNLEQVLKAAQEASIEHLLCVGTTLSDQEEILKLIEPYTYISASIGLHPTEQPQQEEPTVEFLCSAAKHPKIKAIGETGLDYCRTDDPKETSIKTQENRFAVHIEAAKKTQKPLIIHTRQAKKETIALMQAEGAREIGGVMHCFTEDWETAFKALDLGFYISFSGIVTFKNAIDLQSVAKKVPLDRLLIETDSPYLAPVPYRGKINQPAYVKEVALFLANLRSISFESIAEYTTHNFRTLFMPNVLSIQKKP